MKSRHLSALAFVLGAAGAPLSAQGLGDIGVRAAPQIHTYRIQSPSNLSISEFSLPVFVLVPVTRALTFDIGTSLARSHVEQTTSAGTTTSAISGLTDTQIRGNYTFGNDLVVLTAGVNLPTGRSTVTEEQRVAASLIGSDFLAFPISNMGTGFGGTAGVAVARPVGDWNIGLGASIRHAAAYDPFEVTGGPALHYQPGNELRLRGGIDRAIGTGRATLGLTYSTFGNDNLAGSIYNTGNRWITQFGFNNVIGAGELAIVGWNLFRAAGSLADGSFSPREDIGNAQASYGITVGPTIFEPNIEARTWMQGGGVPTSMMGTLGLRAQVNVLGLAVMPSVGYSFGRLAAQDEHDVTTTAAMTGFHASLAIRLH